MCDVVVASLDPHETMLLANDLFPARDAYSVISRVPVRRQTVLVSFPLPASSCFHLQPTPEKQLPTGDSPFVLAGWKKGNKDVCAVVKSAYFP